MPVPRPQKDEDKNKFMSRCVGFLHSENKKKPEGQKWSQDQMVAICFSQWKNKSKAAISQEEKEADEVFVQRFIKKYPKYKKYFEEETVEE